MKHQVIMYDDNEAIIMDLFQIAWPHLFNRFMSSLHSFAKQNRPGTALIVSVRFYFFCERKVYEKQLSSAEFNSERNELRQVSKMRQRFRRE